VALSRRSDRTCCRKPGAHAEPGQLVIVDKESVMQTKKMKLIKELVSKNVKNPTACCAVVVANV
jgi:hypothetical protein